MDVCIYECMHTCVCDCIHAYTYENTHTYVYTCINLHEIVFIVLECLRDWARKKLHDDTVRLRRERQEARSFEAPTWINGIVEACHRKMEESVLQLVSQILLAAMDKAPGEQS